MKTYLANGKDVFWAFIDLEKTYDTIDRHGMRQMLRVYGVGGKFLKEVQSFYVDSRACVRVEMDASVWFPINVRLRQGDVSMVVYGIYAWCGARGVNARVQCNYYYSRVSPPWTIFKRYNSEYL